MTDNIAILDGYTQECLAVLDGGRVNHYLNVLVRPEDICKFGNLSYSVDQVKVWDCLGQEYVYIEPYLWDLDTID